MIPLIMSVLYVWAQLNRDMIVSFWFGTRFKVCQTEYWKGFCPEDAHEGGEGQNINIFLLLKVSHAFT